MIEIAPGPGIRQSDKSELSGSGLTTRVVRTQQNSTRSFTREVIAGSNPRSNPPAIATVQQQFQGDHFMLNDNASIEMYRLMHTGRPIGEAIRYRRPTSAFLRLSSLGGVDVMLYRKAHIG